MTNFRQRVKDILRRRYGIDICRYPLYRLLGQRNISMILDVGANRGQFALDVYGSGYAGRCWSFEPIPEAYEELNRNCRKYKGWECFNVALSNFSGSRSLTITANEASSSFYSPVERQIALHRNLLDVKREVTVSVDTLNAITRDLQLDEIPTLLKVDVQGSEVDVLEGASGILERLSAILVEGSLDQVYSESFLIEEVIFRLRRAGYRPVHVKPGFKNDTSWEFLDADVLFVNDRWR